MADYLHPYLHPTTPIWLIQPAINITINSKTLSDIITTKGVRFYSHQIFKKGTHPKYLELLSPLPPGVSPWCFWEMFLWFEDRPVIEDRSATQHGIADVGGTSNYCPTTCCVRWFPRRPHNSYRSVPWSQFWPPLHSYLTRRSLSIRTCISEVYWQFVSIVDILRASSWFPNQEDYIAFMHSVHNTVYNVIAYW